MQMEVRRYCLTVCLRHNIFCWLLFSWQTSGDSISDSQLTSVLLNLRTHITVFDFMRAFGIQIEVGYQWSQQQTQQNGIGGQVFEWVSIKCFWRHYFVVTKPVMSRWCGLIALHISNFTPSYLRMKRVYHWNHRNVL